MTAPLALAYLASLVGVGLATRHLSGPYLSAYLVTLTFVPQFGLFSDWGRYSQILFNQPGARSWNVNPLGVAKLLPVLTLPTLAISASSLIFVSLSSQSVSIAAYTAVAATISGVLISSANALRHDFLRSGSPMRFFWAHTWVAVGLPASLVLERFFLLGVIAVSMGYLAHMSYAVGKVYASSGLEAAAPESMADFLRSDAATWAFGFSQVGVAFSASLEIPLLILLAPGDVVVYAAGLRICQAVSAFAVRPAEGQLGRLLASSGQPDAQWSRAVRLSLVLGLTGGVALLFGGPFLGSQWVDQPVPATLMAAFFCVVFTGLYYRFQVFRLTARKESAAVMSATYTELTGKIVIAFLLVPAFGGPGLAWALAGAQLVSGVEARWLRHRADTKR